MIKTSASKFKAKLGQYMHAVREGKEVQITDRERPVAKLVPIRSSEQPNALRVSHAKDPSSPALGRIKIHPLTYRGTDTTALLREDRDRR